MVVLALALGLLFALPALASAATYTVNSLGAGENIAPCEDGNTCTLRDAIQKANADPGADTIHFEVAGTIDLTANPLPAVTTPVTIDGTSAPGYAGVPKVVLSGAPSSGEGLNEGLALLGGSAGSKVEGLAIGGFDLGIQMAGESQVCASYIGVATDGTSAIANNVGVETGGAHDRIGAGCTAHGGNVISGNTSFGIVDFGEETLIARNKIGVDATGAPLKNGRPTSIGAGILVSEFAVRPSIRGVAGIGGEPGNVIADNEGAGILVESGGSEANIRENSIHGNSRAAIEIQAPPQVPAPEIETSTVKAETSAVLGNLEAQANEGYEIDVFASPTCYPGGAGEAQLYIGTIFTNTNGSGDATFFSEELAEPPNGYEFFTATATAEETGATSIVSLCQDQPPGVSVGSVPNSISPSSEASFPFIGLDANGKVASFECSIDGGAFESCSSPQSYTGLKDGEHTFELRAIDQVGTVQKVPFHYSWTVDTTFPATTFESGPPSKSNQTTADFQFAVTDFGGSGIKKEQCRLDNGPKTQCTSPVHLESLADGPHEFQVWLTDNAGHESVNFANWTVDTEPPTATIESGPSGPFGSEEATFTFSGADNDGGTGVAALECSFDGHGFSPCTSPRTLTGLGDGPHVFEVQAIDAAGNVSDTVTRGWTVDTIAPQIALGGRSSDPTGERFGTVEFDATDPGGTGIAKTECRFDGAQLAPCTSPATINGLADGLHTFEVKATDGAGNSATKTYSWNVDGTPPTATIDSKPANPISSASASFSFSGNDGTGTGVQAFECRLDSAGFEPCTSPKAFSGLADGVHTFEVKASDKVGNAGDPAAYTWTVDTTAPQVILGSKPANPTTQSFGTVEFDATDPGGSGIAKTECRFDSAALSACTSPDSITPLADGSHTFEVKATDNAGNSTTQTYSWTSDATPPTTTIGSKPADPTNSTNATFSFTGTDPSPGTGVAGFECRLDTQSFAPCSSTKNYSGLANGTHTFEVRSFDVAGNPDLTPDSYEWHVDSSIPNTPQLTRTSPPSPAADPAPLLFGTAPAATTIRVYANATCSGQPALTATPGELEAGLEVSAAPDAVTRYTATATSGTNVTSACSAPLSYREDSTAPTTTIETAPAESTASTTARFTFNGADPGGSGVDGFECRLDSADFAPCTSPAQYSGLGEDSHRFEVRAFDFAGNVDASSAEYSWRVDIPSSAPPPETRNLDKTEPAPKNGETVAVAPEGGKVLVQRPGQKKPTELKEGETIPVGSIVDATKGKVLLTSVNANGETQSAYFYGGKFVVLQHDGSGLVVLKLRGELNCGGAARRSSASASGAKSGRRLWGSGHGNFRTEGSSGSATVRGTIWLTEDRCDGSTFFKVKRGVVSVRDFTTNKTLSVPAGKTYTAGP